MIRLVLLLMCLAGPALAEVLVAVRTIPAQTIIAAEDLAFKDAAGAGGLDDPAQLVGMEARVALFPGRPIRLADVGPPAVVERNALVKLVYETAGLTITTDGRALDRAGPGDLIRVMNLASRTTVTAQIDAMGVAHVSR